MGVGTLPELPTDPHTQLVVIAWVTCSLTLLLVLACLFPGITEYRPRLRRVRGAFRKPGGRGRHGLGPKSAPEGDGGSQDDRPDTQEGEGQA